MRAPHLNYRAIADACEVEMQALLLQSQALATQVAAMKRRRDAYRDLEHTFTPHDQPLPRIVPPAYPDDPDFTDPPEKDSP